MLRRRKFAEHGFADLNRASDLFCQCEVVHRPWAPRRVFKNRLSEARTLRQLDIAANHGVKDLCFAPGRAVASALGKEVFQVANDFVGKSSASVE